MGNDKRAARSRSEQGQRPPSNYRRPPQQKEQPESPFLGTIVGGPQKRPPVPFLSNTMTASSLTDPHYRANFGMSSASQSSGSNHSKRGGVPPNESYISSTSSTHASNTSSTSRSSSKLVFTSPRCEIEDSKLFPNSPLKRSLANLDKRWKKIGEQAGSHKQDSSVLHVSRRHMTPSVLKSGVTPQVANRIKELHLRLDQAEDMLPEWLDVISEKFSQLEHLVLTRDQPETPDGQPSRLRRLYILYRLPQLISIDGVAVTKSERRLARPDDPNGNKVVSQPKPNESDDKTQRRKSEGAKPETAVSRSDSLTKAKEKRRRSRHVGNEAKTPPNDQDRGSDPDESDQEDGMRFVSLSEVATESGEGYELDVDLEKAIQKITDTQRTRSQSVPGRRQQEHRDEVMTPGKKNAPQSSHRQGNNKVNPPPNNKQKHEGDKRIQKMHVGDLQLVECDSTVTSTYGYGHWTGACFAPFAVCAPKPKKKPNKISKVHGNSNGNNTSQNYNQHPDNIKSVRKHAKEDDSSVDPRDQESSLKDSLPVKSYKYSSLVDETRREVKQQRKLMKESTSGSYVPSQVGSNSVPSSKRSNKYSRLLGGLNDKTGNTNGSEDFDIRENQRNKPNNNMPELQKSNAARLTPNPIVSEQLQAQSQKVTPSQQSAQSAATSKLPSTQEKEKKASNKPVRNATLEDDEVGTMTGVIIVATPDANSGMSVATLPSILQRQAEKFDAAQNTSKIAAHESENLATRRNLAGVTIDVPPITPIEAQKEPINKTNGKLTIEQHQSQSSQEESQAKQEIAKQNVPVTVSPASESQYWPRDQAEPNETPQTDITSNVGCEPKLELQVPFDSMLDTLGESSSMDTPGEGPTDPEIVEMVMKRLGNQAPNSDVSSGAGTRSKSDGNRDSGDIVMRRLMGIETRAVKNNASTPPSDLQIPQLTPTSNNKIKSEAFNSVPQRLLAVRSSSMPPIPGGVSEQNNTILPVTADRPADASTKIYNNFREKKQQLQRKQQQQERQSSSQFEPPNPASTNSSDSHDSSRYGSQIRPTESSTSDSGTRSKENFHELEARLDNLIQKLPRSRLRSSSIPPSPKGPLPLTEADQKKMAEAVSKLDENLRTILELHHLHSPERPPLSPDKQSRQSQSRSGTPRHSAYLPSVNFTEASPLEKLETTMAGLFSAIMAQMSPQKRLLTPAESNRSPSKGTKKERKKDSFFQGKGENAEILDEMKSIDDESTLFVVEIKKKDVPESVTNDFDLRHDGEKPAFDAPSEISLAGPSIQSSVTVFQSSRQMISSRLHASPYSAGSQDHELVALQKMFQNAVVDPSIIRLDDQDPTIIDLCDKSTIATFRPENIGAAGGGQRMDSPEVINLIDARSQQTQETIVKVAQPPNQVLLPALDHSEAAGANESYSGTNCKGTTNSGQGSKLGMVVHLATVYENEVPSEVEAAAPDGELETTKQQEQEAEIAAASAVAAAAAGAAAGSEASGDHAPLAVSDQTVTHETDYPSDFIPKKHEDADDENRTKNAPPKEIVTTPEVNPILAVLQAPIISSYREAFSFQKKVQSSDGSTGDFPSTSIIPYPEEVVVQKESDPTRSWKEPALIAELLTSSPKNCLLSQQARRDVAGVKQDPSQVDSSRLPQEITAIINKLAEITSKVSALGKPAQPTLPREVLALLHEYEKSSHSSADGIPALLPSEIVMKFGNAYGRSHDIEDRYQAISLDAGSQQEVMGAFADDVQPLSPGAFPASIPENIRVMLSKVDWNSLNNGGNRHVEGNHHSVSQGIPHSLPQEVMAMQMQRPQSSDCKENYGIGSASSSNTSPSDDASQEMSWYMRSLRQYSDEDSTGVDEYTADMHDEQSFRSGTQQTETSGREFETVPSEQMSRIFLTRAQQAFLRVHERSVVGTLSRETDEDFDLQHHPSQFLRDADSIDDASFENNLVPDPASLPSNIEVEKGLALRSKGNSSSGNDGPCYQSSVPSKIEVNNCAASRSDGTGSSANNTPALQASLPANIDVDNGLAYQAKSCSAASNNMPSSLPSKIEVTNTPHYKRNDSNAKTDGSSSLPRKRASRNAVSSFLSQQSKEPPSPAWTASSSKHGKLGDSITLRSPPLPSKVVVSKDVFSSHSTTNVSSPRKSAAPSKSSSLHSPMKFRARLVKTLKVSTPPQSKASPDSNTGHASLLDKVATPTASNVSATQNGESFPAKRPNEANVAKQDQTANTKSSGNASTVPSRQFKPVASPFLKSRAKKNAARSQAELLPATHASSTMTPLPATSPRAERIKRSISRWKQQRFARFDGEMEAREQDTER